MVKAEAASVHASNRRVGLLFQDPPMSDCLIAMLCRYRSPLQEEADCLMAKARRQAHWGSVSTGTPANTLVTHHLTAPLLLSQITAAGAGASADGQGGGDRRTGHMRMKDESVSTFATFLDSQVAAAGGG